MLNGSDQKNGPLLKREGMEQKKRDDQMIRMVVLIKALSGKTKDGS
jgi:hypothetical protein